MSMAYLIHNMLINNDATWFVATPPHPRHACDISCFNLWEQVRQKCISHVNHIVFSMKQGLTKITSPNEYYFAGGCHRQSEADHT